MKIRYLLIFIITYDVSMAQSSEDITVFYKTKNLIGKTVNGTAQGAWKYTFDSLKCDLFFKNGLKEGIQTSYYPSGEKMAVKNYYEDGLLQGYQFMLFKNGDTAFKENYDNGIPHGKWTSYHKSQNLNFKSFKPFHNFSSLTLH